MGKFDVVSVCNALVDVLFDASDDDLRAHGLTKGNMHLVDQAAQQKLLTTFGDQIRGEELGGSSMNCIRSLAQLGKKTAFAGMVAEDRFGGMISDRMDELGIVKQLGRNAKEATGTCMILVTPDGERTMVTYLGASRLYTKADVPRDQLGTCEFFHFCGYQWDTAEQKDAIEEAICVAKAAGAKISFDLADPFVVGAHKEDFVRIVADHADIVFANKEEAALLYGESPEATAERISSCNAIAVIKLGAKGALIKKGESLVQVSPVAAKVVDTTAAGDMFAAGFLYGLCNGRELDECGRIAATLASDVISRYGASLSSEVLEKVRSL